MCAGRLSCRRNTTFRTVRSHALARKAQTRLFATFGRQWEGLETQECALNRPERYCDHAAAAAGASLKACLRSRHTGRSSFTTNTAQMPSHCPFRWLCRLLLHPISPVLPLASPMVASSTSRQAPPACRWMCWSRRRPTCSTGEAAVGGYFNPPAMH